MTGTVTTALGSACWCAVGEHRPTVFLQNDVFPPEGKTLTAEEVAQAAWEEIKQWVRDGYLPYLTVKMPDGRAVDVDLEELDG